MNRPLNIAHRGGANLWPENTLEAFDNAINAGVDGIECDIQHTRDDRLVIHHDDRLKPEATRESGNWLTAPHPEYANLTEANLTCWMSAACNRTAPTAKPAPDKRR